MSTKQHMLDEAYLLFAEYGQYFTLSQVTKSLGIKKQSIYNYFDKKDTLILEMLNEQITKYINEIDNILMNVSELTLKEQLYEFGLSFIYSYHNDNRIKARRALSMIIHKDNMIPIKLILNENRLKYEDFIIQLLKVGVTNGIIKDEDLSFMCCFFFTFIRGLLDEFTVSNPYSTTEEFYDDFFIEYWTMISLKEKK